MSGHSKWATIKRKKEKTDAARGKIFTKLLKEVMTAAKLGGGNEDANPRLKTAMLKAKSSNVPMENITKAKLKGSGELPGVSYEDINYEGYGPGGVAIIIETMTDNKVRTVGEVRHIFTRYGGNLGENGSVSWMFKKLGQIIIDANGKNEDQVMEDALEAGAEDMKIEDDKFIIMTAYEDYLSVCDKLEKKYEFESNEITMISDNSVKVPSDKVKNLFSLLEGLEDLDDVEGVYNNADIEDGDIEAME
ncbi:MAG: YebC/PmpR family DNA-binding transcriptional regulator [Candidatus Delongbacteria bacterium]|nr:YebC/PmpR family DNA-binding transcriptional regulator [Candidatus Delongbacteria bacterium]MCG2760242.1 YebC/PmpR family DNA-binding transcriptional regulator [Candidatus Delongbacteria bacterium]